MALSKNIQQHVVFNPGVKVLQFLIGILLPYTVYQSILLSNTISSFNDAFTIIIGIICSVIIGLNAYTWYRYMTKFYMEKEPIAMAAITTIYLGLTLLGFFFTIAIGAASHTTY